MVQHMQINCCIFLETEKSGPHPKPPEFEALQVTAGLGTFGTLLR